MQPWWTQETSFKNNKTLKKDVLWLANLFALCVMNILMSFHDIYNRLIYRQPLFGQFDLLTAV